MRRSTLILLAVAVVLAAVLAVQRIDFSGPPPQIGPWEGEADKIVIQKKEERILARKSSAGWLLTEKEYPADSQKIDRILSALRDIGTVEVVSTRSGEYGRYELTEEAAQKVTVYKGDSVLRELYVGKNSSVGRKTYARQADKERVVLVSRSLKKAVDTTVAELRDKTVVEIDREKLERVEISAPGGPSVALLRSESAGGSGDGSEEGSEGQSQSSSGDEGESGSGSSSTHAAASWRVEGVEKEVSAERINAFFRTVTPLTATSFDTEEPQGEPIGTMRFVMKDGSEETLRLYPEGKKEGVFPATATTVPYPFLITVADAKDLSLQLKEFLPAGSGQPQSPQPKTSQQPVLPQQQ